VHSFLDSISLLLILSQHSFVTLRHFFILMGTADYRFISRRKEKRHKVCDLSRDRKAEAIEALNGTG
jgi:hypothetical protein